jgi:hypothetical protein
MKMKSLTILALAGLMTFSLAAPLLAGSGTDMFKSTDKKQTAKDFSLVRKIRGLFPERAALQVHDIKRFPPHDRS